VFGTTLKKWSVGSPLQSVLDSVSALLADPAVRADNIRHIRVDVPTVSLRIVDNSAVSDLSLQQSRGHDDLDRGATFASIHDHARMSDPNVLAIRKLVELVGSEELDKAVPVRQAIVRIELSMDVCSIIGPRWYAAPRAIRWSGKRSRPKRSTPPRGLGAARAQELIETIGSLERVEKVTSLRRLLQA